MSVNEMSAGDVMSFLVAAQTVQRSLAQVSLLYGEVLKGLGAGASVFEVGTLFALDFLNFFFLRILKFNLIVVFLSPYFYVPLPFLVY